ncbi:Sedoheptulokinase [Collichthys lucidus]|uniref:Sedoheptulokinase n=1 Tax=Collichthys lucidus TaxID=240159 RepID=A0A4U5V7C8_COLLU|nr:Sedoheptulokinase [Collichthys lucidus]
MSAYILGVDVGTTSVKAVLLKTGSKAVVAGHALPTSSDIIDDSGIKAKEQHTGRIIDTLNRCISLLPADKLKHVSSIGLSGQMHGVLFWKAKGGCDWSKRDFFTAGDTSQLITWQDGRCSSDFLSSLPAPDSHLSVATGFGCATIFWYMKHRPEFLEDFTVAGTIQDYVVSMLCGLVLNISTSAQLTFAMPADFKPSNSPQPASSISYFPYFKDSYLAVAASLNGGNVLGTFVEMLTAWMKELGAELSDSCVYEKMIRSALNQETTDLRVSPTILGERHNPLCLGQVNNISPTNLSLGHLTRAMCRGVLDNITSMMPAERLQQAGVSRIVGTGSAIARNQVLRQEVEKAFPQPVVYGQNADSAVGVAMVLCDLL